MMFAKLLCLFGIHDWCVTKWKSEGDIICEKRAREANPGEYTGWFQTLGRGYQDKTCVRCQKRVDEISEHEAYLIKSGYFVKQ